MKYLLVIAVILIPILNAQETRIVGRELAPADLQHMQSFEDHQIPAENEVIAYQEAGQWKYGRISYVLRFPGGCSVLYGVTTNSNGAVKHGYVVNKIYLRKLLL